MNPTNTLPDSTKPLSIYNAWLRNYAHAENGKSAFEALTEDLPRIAEMKFNSIYLNPFYKIGAYPKSTGEVGSLYATADMSQSNPAMFAGKAGAFFEGEQVTELGQQVQNFTAEAQRHGIVPMFDLVQGQLSPDSPYIEDAKKLGIELLLTHKSTGKIGIHGLDENHLPLYTDPKQVWDDTVKFNYSDPKARAYIQDKILIPYVQEMAKLGFRGVRIDSTPEAPTPVHRAVVQAFRAERKKLDGSEYTKPIVLAETLKDDVKYRPTEVAECADTCYDSGHWYPNKEVAKGEPVQKNFETLFDPKVYNESSWLKNKRKSFQNVLSDFSAGKDIHGSTISCVTTHDTTRLKTQLKDLFEEELSTLPEHEANKHIARLAKIKIAFSALTSGGGYMITSSDEFLAEERCNIFDGKVVDEHSHDPQQPYEQRQGYRHAVWKEGDNPHTVVKIATDKQEQVSSLVEHYNDNLSPFIKSVNNAVSKRKTIAYDFESNVYFSDKDKDIFCVIGKGQNGTDISVIDVSGKDRKIDEMTLRHLANKSGVNVGEFLRDAAYISDHPQQLQKAAVNQR